MKGLKFWKKWSFLAGMVCLGFSYFCFVDRGQMGLEALGQAGAFCEDFLSGIRKGAQGSSGASSQGGGQSGTHGEGTSGGEGAQGSSGASSQGGGQSGTHGEGTSGGKGAQGSSSTPSQGEGQGEVQGEAQEEALPQFVTVEDDYFSDAVFIGDSRTVGLFEYGGLEETAAFYASTGLTVYQLFDAAIVKTPEKRQKITVEEALTQNRFSKIYLMLGINEMGTGTVETFAEAYQAAVEHLLEIQPDAILYIQGIMKVTAKRSKQGDYINNEGIIARNEQLEKLADNRRVFYLDVNPLVCDETGGMTESYTTDGVHLKARYIEIWKDYLKQHAVVWRE